MIVMDCWRVGILPRVVMVRDVAVRRDQDAVTDVYG